MGGKQEAIAGKRSNSLYGNSSDECEALDSSYSEESPTRSFSSSASLQSKGKRSADSEDPIQSIRDANRRNKNRRSNAGRSSSP